MASETPSLQDSLDLQPSTAPPGLQQPTSDDFFNFELVSFQVENKIFRVTKSGFNTPGSSFQTTFLPFDDQHAEGGGSNEKPIQLRGIKESHFCAFLKQIYRLKNDPPVVEFDDWVGILKLSTMCDIQTVRAEAIKALTSLLPNKSALEKIHLGRRYKVPTWIRKGYIELVRDKSLKLHKLTKPPSSISPLDWETIAKIYHIREIQNFNMLSSTSYRCQPCQDGAHYYSYREQPAKVFRRCPAGHATEFDSSSPSFTPTKACSENLVDTTFSEEFDQIG